MCWSWVCNPKQWGDASWACVGVDYKVETFRKNFRNSQQMG